MRPLQLILSICFALCLPITACWGQSSNVSSQTKSSPITRHEPANACGCNSSKPLLISTIVDRTSQSIEDLFSKKNDRVALATDCTQHSKPRACQTKCRCRKPIQMTLFPCNKCCGAKRLCEEGKLLGDSSDFNPDPPKPIEKEKGAPPRPLPGARILPRWLTSSTESQPLLQQVPDRVIPAPVWRATPQEQRTSSKPRIVSITDQNPRDTDRYVRDLRAAARKIQHPQAPAAEVLSADPQTHENQIVAAQTTEKLRAEILMPHSQTHEPIMPQPRLLAPSPAPLHSLSPIREIELQLVEPVPAKQNEVQQSSAIESDAAISTLDPIIPYNSLRP